VTARRRALTFSGLAVLAIGIAEPAGAAVLVPLGTQQWQASTEAGFAVTSPTTLRAPAGSYQNGAWAGFSWCTPYRASRIHRVVVRAYRYHQSSVVRIEVGPNTDGSLGPSQPESTLPTGDPGTPISIDPLLTACVGARARQTGTQQVTFSRIWNLVLEDVVLSDDQGPSIDAFRLEGPQQAGWFTGPVTVVWSASDNDLLRGVTGAAITPGGDSIDRGDTADGTEMRSTLNPGSDGSHTVRVWRTGGNGWKTAEHTADIRVDRTPPSVPIVAASPAARGPAPIVLTASGSVDAPNGSGLARYEFTTDDGRTLLQTASITRVGRFDIRARAVDIAGNASAWSLPIQVEVTGPAQTAQPSGAPATPDGPAAPSATPGELPDLTGVRLATLGAARPRVRERPRTHLQLRPVWGSRGIVVGRFVRGDGTGLADVPVVARGPRGVDLGKARTDSTGRFRVSFRTTRSGTYSIVAVGRPEVGGRAYVAVRPTVAVDRRLISSSAYSDQMIALRPGRWIVVSGTAAPRRLMAGRAVQLQYRSGREWLPVGAPTTVNSRGRWVLRYRVARPGRVSVLMRVVLPGPRRLGFAQGMTSPFVVRIT
jgi:hypothetical protein